MNPASTDEKLAWVRDAAGDRFADLEIQAFAGFVHFTDDPAGMATRWRPRSTPRPTTSLDSPVGLVGTVESDDRDARAAPGPLGHELPRGRRGAPRPVRARRGAAGRHLTGDDMAHDRKFRFGVQCSSASSAADWRDRARKMEDLGYSTLFMPDHFVGTPLAPMVAIAMAAEATTTLRVGHARARQRLQAPGGRRQGSGDDRPALRRPDGARHRRRLDDGRLRRARPAVRPAGRAHRAARGGARGHQGLLHRRGPFDFDGEHYTITDYDAEPEARAAAAPADRHRRWRPARSCGSPAARPTSSASTRTSARVRSTADAVRERAGGRDRAEDRVGARRRGRSLRRPRAADPLLRGRDHRRRRSASPRRSAAAYGLKAEDALESGVALVGSVDQLRRDAPEAPRGVGRVLRRVR